MSAQDDLTAALCLAIQRLTQIQKARFLLNTALTLIENGQYGEEVESYLGLCLETPGLSMEDTERAWLAQRNVRKLGSGQLQPEIHFSVSPACQRIPVEIWEQIAAQTPRYHLRKWLFLSPLHRDIACRLIFHTVDVYLYEFDVERGLDFLERAMGDSIFVSRVKSLRLYWDRDDIEGELSEEVELILRIVKISLPAFKALRDFQWIGKIQMPEWMVKILLNIHKDLHGLGFSGSLHLDAVAASAFHNLRKFAYHVEEDDNPDWENIRNMLDLNVGTLKHLILSFPSLLDDDDSRDLVFESVTIENLTHLSLFSRDISSFVLERIADAHKLQSLTLHGLFSDSESASHMLLTSIRLPHLESFGFDMESFWFYKEELNDLYGSVTYFLRKSEKLRRLDLGGCPWNMVQPILPDLGNLRVLAVCIDEPEQIKSLVEAIPKQMVAIRLSVNVSDSDRPLDEYAQYFTRFTTLSFLHLQLSKRPVTSRHKDFQVQMDKSLHSIAAAVPSLDFLACYGELYIIERSHGELELETRLVSSRLEYGSGVDIVSEDIAWLWQKLKDDPEEI